MHFWVSNGSRSKQSVLTVKTSRYDWQSVSQGFRLIGLHLSVGITYIASVSQGLVQSRRYTLLLL